MSRRQGLSIFGLAFVFSHIRYGDQLVRAQINLDYASGHASELHIYIYKYVYIYVDIRIHIVIGLEDHGLCYQILELLRKGFSTNTMLALYRTASRLHTRSFD